MQDNLIYYSNRIARNSNPNIPFLIASQYRHTSDVIGCTCHWDGTGGGCRRRLFCQHCATTRQNARAANPKFDYMPATSYAFCTASSKHRDVRDAGIDFDSHYISNLYNRIVRRLGAYSKHTGNVVIGDLEMSLVFLYPKLKVNPNAHWLTSYYIEDGLPDMSFLGKDLDIQVVAMGDTMGDYIACRAYGSKPIELESYYKSAINNHPEGIYRINRNMAQFIERLAGLPTSGVKKMQFNFGF